MWLDRLWRIALLNLALHSLASLVAIALKLPYAVGGVGDPNTVAEDFLVHGTALSAPLVTLIILVILILGVRRVGVWGMLAHILLILLGVVFTVAGFMEPITLRILQNPPLTAQGIGIVLLALDLLYPLIDPRIRYRKG